MEVVLADGQLLRTGMGLMPNSNTWQVFAGAMADAGRHLHAVEFRRGHQMGMWLMPEPPDFRRSASSTPREPTSSRSSDALRRCVHRDGDPERGW